MMGKKKNEKEVIVIDSSDSDSDSETSLKELKKLKESTEKKKASISFSRLQSNSQKLSTTNNSLSLLGLNEEKIKEDLGLKQKESKKNLFETEKDSKKNLFEKEKDSKSTVEISSKSKPKALDLFASSIENKSKESAKEVKISTDSKKIVVPEKKDLSSKASTSTEIATQSKNPKDLSSKASTSTEIATQSKNTLPKIEEKEKKTQNDQVLGSANKAKVDEAPNPPPKIEEEFCIGEFNGKNVTINNHIKNCLKEHQVDAISFCWKKIIQEKTGLQEFTLFIIYIFPTDSFLCITGCVLAHSMGLGKTLAVIVFIHCFLQNKLGTHVIDNYSFFLL